MLVEKTPIREILFWNKVNKIPGEDSCWLWTGAKNGKGYGWITVYVNKKQRFFFVHKVSFEWEFGEIPNGKIIRHKCDTPLCVRPSHLLLGTHQDNTNDMMSRGRYVSGVAVITAGVASAIRLRRSQGESVKSIAFDFNLTPQHVSNICTGVYWSTADGPITRRFVIDDNTVIAVKNDLLNLTRKECQIKYNLSKAAIEQIASGKRTTKKSV